MDKDALKEACCIYNISLRMAAWPYMADLVEHELCMRDQRMFLKSAVATLRFATALCVDILVPATTLAGPTWTAWCSRFTLYRVWHRPSRTTMPGMNC